MNRLKRHVVVFTTEDSTDRGLPDLEIVVFVKSPLRAIRKGAQFAREGGFTPLFGGIEVERKGRGTIEDPFRTIWSEFRQLSTNTP